MIGLAPSMTWYLLPIGNGDDGRADGVSDGDQLGAGQIKKEAPVAGAFKGQ
ncbi:MAG TPA: hypothetical protein VGL40_14355 [Bacillota bacterium]|jgi:hypothetical protein